METTQRVHDDCLHGRWVALQERNTELGESIAFIVRGNNPASFLEGDIASSLKVALCKHNPGKYPRKEGFVP